MPVILRREVKAARLDPLPDNPGKVMSLVRPYPAGSVAMAVAKSVLNSSSFERANRSIPLAKRGSSTHVPGPLLYAWAAAHKKVDFHSPDR
jgi:hypothetical protein